MAKDASAPRELTGEEAQIYDRQIRLWGVDAQRLLAASNVLITGAATSLLAQEVAKNIVLAGISTLTLCMEPSEGVDTHGFLGGDLNAMAAALTDINPLVLVKVVPALDVNSAGVDVSNFSLVCAVDCAEEYERAIATACRRSLVPFQCGRAPGPVGYFFQDPGASYKYSVRTVKAAKKGETPVEIEKEFEASFATYSEALESPWGFEPRKGKSDCGWHVACVLRAFEREFGRLPGGQEGEGKDEEDVSRLRTIYASLVEEKKPVRTNEELVKYVGATACYTLPPVCAIVGGMWGKEAVKIVSRRDHPLSDEQHNFFFFSSSSSHGCLEKIPCH